MFGIDPLLVRSDALLETRSKCYAQVEYSSIRNKYRQTGQTNRHGLHGCGIVFIYGLI